MLDIEAIYAAATAAMPRELCGLMVRGSAGIDDDHFRACRNLSAEPDHFIIAPEDFAAAEDVGEITAIVHSHVYRPPAPSMADRVGCERSGLPWIIVSVPTRTFHWLRPTGYRPPLEGRPFVWGVLDCFALIRDYYHDELGIEMPDFTRSEGWEARGEDLYRKHFAAAGFELVSQDLPLQLHDVVVMQIRADDPNHGGVICADGVLLHHPVGGLSRSDVYGGYYRKCTVMTLRHRSLA